jgi:hypothetical protein
LPLARLTWAAALEELVARIMITFVMIASQEVVLAQSTAVPGDKQAMALGWRYRPRLQGTVVHGATSTLQHSQYCDESYKNMHWRPRWQCMFPAQEQRSLVPDVRAMDYESNSCCALHARINP